MAEVEVRRSARPALGNVTDDIEANANPLTSPLPVPQSPMLRKPILKSFAWRKINLSYEKNGKTINVLHNVSGVINSGELVAILGPSGAGKSTMLDILAHRKNTGNLTGELLLNGLSEYSSKIFQNFSSYVTQDEAFHPTQTVEEAIDFYAQLRLGHSATQTEKRHVVDFLLADVGLAGKEKQYVGGILPGGLSITGLSGGERRRLALCCGAVTNPDLMFLDEITSGLDSFAALKVLQLIRRFCDRGKMVITSIHQPRATIYNTFDKVLVLSQGRLVYFGPAKMASDWFEITLGYPKTAGLGTADYILDLVATGFQKEVKEGERTMRTIEDIDQASAAFHNSTMHSDLIMAKIEDLTMKKKPITSKGNKPLYVWEQFAVVLKRNLFFYYRNPFNVLARSMTVIFLAIVTGLIWLGAASESKNQDPFRFFNIGGGMFACLFSQLLIPFSSMSLFIYDRKFYSRESAVKLYSPSVYFFANMTLEGTLHTINALIYTLIVFHMIDLNNFWGYFGVMALIVHIGNCMIQYFCLITTNQDQAFAIATAYVSVAIATGGFLAPYPYLYKNMLWLQWLSVVKYPFQILVYQQLSSPLTDVYLQKLEMNRPSTWQANVGCMLAFYIFFYTGGFLGLRYLNREKR